MNKLRSQSSKATGKSYFRVRGVPILNYHGLSETMSPEIPVPARRFWISPTKFRSHLTCIRDEGVPTILLSEFGVKGRDAYEKSRTVVVTFDDGLLSDFETAFPLLAEFGMRAVFFLNSSTVGQAGYLNWPQIREMQRFGMSIQSHAHHHLDLTVLPTPVLDAELEESKRRLEDGLGNQVDYLAAPHGLLDRRVVRRALLMGYSAVCSTRCWPASRTSKTLTRITLHRDVQIEEFRSFLRCEFKPYARRLARGFIYRPQAIAGHLYASLRYRWFKRPVPVSK